MTGHNEADTSEPGYVRLDARSLLAEVERHDGILVLALTDDAGNVVDLHPGADADPSQVAGRVDRLADRMSGYAAMLRRDIPRDP